jgi:hypothetical protein
MRLPIAFTLDDLLDELQQFDPDAEVRLATQPSWPFEWSLSTTSPAVEVDLDGQPVVYRSRARSSATCPAPPATSSAGSQRHHRPVGAHRVSGGPPDPAYGSPGRSGIPRRSWSAKPGPAARHPTTCALPT